MHRFKVVVMLFAMSVLSSGCSLKDIRSKSILESNSKSSELGRVWIRKMQTAHGGRANWINMGVARFQFRDEWPKFLTRTLAMPWEFSGQRVELTVQLSTDNMYAKFLDGESKGIIWGLQNWQSYKIEKSKLRWTDDSSVKFWLPTINYFVQLPFRISEGDIQLFSDFKVVKGKRYARVFVSWGTASPQDDIDQYILWINAETGLLSFVEYTVRDFGGSVAGKVSLDNFKKHRGLVVPGTVTTIDRIGSKNDEYMHRIIIDSIEFGAVPERPFILDPSKSDSKH